MKESISEQSLKARFGKYQRSGKISAARKVLGQVVRSQVNQSISKTEFRLETGLSQDTADFIGSFEALDDLEPTGVVKEAVIISRAYLEYSYRTWKENDKLCYPDQKGE